MCKTELLENLPKISFNDFPYYVWFEDNDYLVAFSEIPDIGNKLINIQLMTEEEIKQAEKKPLYLKNTVIVILQDKKKCKNYHFVIHEGYDYDGASISRVFWRVIGSKENISYKIASLVHDVLCENHEYINNDRYLSTCIFERLLFVSGVGPVRRWAMKHSVDNWQKFCGWKKK